MTYTIRPSFFMPRARADRLSATSSQARRRPRRWSLTKVPLPRPRLQFRLLTIKEEHPVKSLLLATALLGSVSVPVVDLPKELPGDGTSDATATVHLMLAKGPAAPALPGAVPRGAPARLKGRGYKGKPARRLPWVRREQPNSSADQPTPNEPRNVQKLSPWPLWGSPRCSRLVTPRRAPLSGNPVTRVASGARQRVDRDNRIQGYRS